MSATGKQPLAKAIYSFRDAAEGLDAPDDVCALLYAVDVARYSDRPRASLNRRFAKLRQARPGIFRRLSIWLKSAPVRPHLSKQGAYWAWMIWREVAWKMHRGAKAHAAFGMDEGGRPKSPGFTRADEAAIYALYMRDSGDTTDLDGQIANAAQIYGARLDLIRDALVLAEEIGRDARAEAVMLSTRKRG